MLIDDIVMSGNGRFTRLILCNSGKETRRLSAAKLQALSTSRTAQVTGEEKKEAARSVGVSLSTRNTIPC